MEKSDKSKSSHESIDQLAMDIIHIKYQSIWNRLQVNNTRKWTYWEFNYVSKTPQTLCPLQKRGLVPAVLETASDTSEGSRVSVRPMFVFNFLVRLSKSFLTMCHHGISGPTAFEHSTRLLNVFLWHYKRLTDQFGQTRNGQILFNTM